jgi:hypothetical protein
MRMQAYGPFQTDNSRHMASFGIIMLAFMIIEDSHEKDDVEEVDSDDWEDSDNSEGEGLNRNVL